MIFKKQIGTYFLVMLNVIIVNKTWVKDMSRNDGKLYELVRFIQFKDLLSSVMIDLMHF